MGMDDLVGSFVEARDYVISTLPMKLEIYLLGVWDVFTKHTLIKETVNLIERELIEVFPHIPPKYLPKCRFRIFEETLEIEAGIQNYYNREPELSFLGTSNVGIELFDFYYRYSYDPGFDYMFIARFGHENDNYYMGSKTAKAEYYLGQQTPLSYAYALAIEDGFIG